MTGIAALFACAAAMGGGEFADAAAYQFTRIADTSGPFMSFGDGPAINNLGVVVFQANRDDGTQAVCVGSGGAVTTVADTSVTSPFIQIESRPTINPNSSVIAFKAVTRTTQGVYRGASSPFTAIAEVGSMFGAINGAPSINASGAVGFQATTLPSGAGVFRGTGSTPTIIANTAGGYSAFGMNASINASGVVAFFANRTDTGAAVFSGSGGAITTIAASSSGLYTGFGGTLAINDAGLVALRATLTAGGQAIIVSDGVHSTTIADTSGPYQQFFVPAMNAGRVAFRALLDSNETGIYTGSDPVADRVIRVGDPLDGAAVSSLNLFHEGLNQQGQIAFQCVLSDGRQGVFRATPVNTCPADVDHSNVVNIDDLLEVINHWGACFNCAADIRLSGVVDIDDLLAVINAWGACP